jgi:hypothetical protein
VSEWYLSGSKSIDGIETFETEKLFEEKIERREQFIMKFIEMQ